MMPADTELIIYMVVNICPVHLRSIKHMALYFDEITAAAEVLSTASVAYSSLLFFLSTFGLLPGLKKFPMILTSSWEKKSMCKN